MPDKLDFIVGVTGAVQAGLGVIQTVDGFIQRGKAKKQMAKLQAQRKAYETPEEVYKILQATQQNAQTGLGAQTLNYLTGNADQVFSQAIGAITLNGGDPNSLGALFEQRVNQSMAIGAQDQAAQMANFAKYLGALNTLGENKAAEQQSKDNLLKDQIQAASAQGADATKGIQSGTNAVIGSFAAGQQMNLYKDQLDFLRGSGNIVGGNGYSTAPPLVTSASQRTTNSLPTTISSPRR